MTSPHLYAVSSAKGGPRYVAWGDHARELYKDLDYLTGFRGRVESVWLRHGPRRAVVRGGIASLLEAPGVEALQQTLFELPESDAGLMLATGYYKSTWLVGPVRLTDGSGTFVKVFKSPDEAEIEAQRATQAEALGGKSRSFRTLPAKPLGRHGVSYPLVKRTSRARHDVAMSIATEIGDAHAPQIPTNEFTRRWHERAEITGATLVQLTVEGADAAHEMLSACVPHQVSPGHGDVTTWNIVMPQDRGTPVLLDYEEVQTLPRYFDLVYAESHPPALVGRASLCEMSQRLLRVRGFSRDDARSLIRSSLAVALMRASTAILNNPSNVARLTRQVRARWQALEGLT